MTANSQVSRIVPYLGRLLQDDYIQEQLSDVVTGLRKSSRRAKGRKPSEAMKDRRLRSQLADAASSLTEAIRTLKQPPPSTRHPVRRALLLVAAAGAIGLTWQKLSSRTTKTNP